MGEIRSKALSNVVPKDILREVFEETLEECANVLTQSYGPDGSTTEIRSSMSEKDTGKSDYTKDGHKILSSIYFSKPIELSVVDDLRSITKDIVKTVGDGTTSAVLLSYYLFKAMEKMSKETKLPDKKIISRLTDTISELNKRIIKNGKAATLDDIYDIAYVSSDGNDEIASTIRDLYKEYGMDAYIDVGISNTQNDMIKKYSGFAIDSGYFNPVFINNRENHTATVRKPKIYIFEDPIDTDDMLVFFGKIIMNNYINPIKNKKFENIVPTVIFTPKFGADIRAEIDSTLSFMNNCPDELKQLLIVTNILDVDKLYDIATLSGARTIKKYIDPKVREADEKRGYAPTLNTIDDFAGEADEVVADINSTRVINPSKMLNPDGSNSITYSNLIYNLEEKLKNYKEENKQLTEIYKLKHRIQALKSNMVEYLIGGISYTDRDAKRDLVEDAVLNCRDAAANGVGRGANFEAFSELDNMLKEKYGLSYEWACMADKDGKTIITDTENYIGELKNRNKDTNISVDIYDPLFILIEAYANLYTMIYRNDIEHPIDIIHSSLEHELPKNLRTGEYDGKVKTSIRSDIIISNAVSKIIGMMFATNQYLLPNPNLNTYVYY